MFLAARADFTKADHAWVRQEKFISWAPGRGRRAAHLRGAELLRAEVVVYDALVNRELLALAPESAEILRGKRSRDHAIPQGDPEPPAGREGQGGQDGRPAEGR